MIIHKIKYGKKIYIHNRQNNLRIGYDNINHTV